MPPDVAVIVPVHDGAATLPRLLAALSEVGADEAVEVVFVDDGSADATPELLAGWRTVRLDRPRGPAAARTAGVAVTTAPLLAFTDADCEPEPGWLRALTAALRDDDLVTGPVRPARPPGPFDRTLSVPGPSPRFETANLGVRREWFDRVGGFEALAAVDDGHFGEDALFGWRAVRAGARVGFAEDAAVRHAVFARRARGHVAEQRRLRFFPWLIREAPEMRRALAGRVFLSRRTAAFDLAVLALAAAALTRRTVLLLGLLPYARARAWAPRELWRPSVIRVNAALVLGDAVGCAALVRGSLAARRIVL